MEWTWPESVSSDRQRVMEELVQGREMVNTLRRALNGDVVSSPEELATQILGSFTNTLMILKGNNHEAKEEFVSQIHQEANSNSNSSNTSTVTAASPSSAAAVDSSSCAMARDDAIKSEDSHDQESSMRNEPVKDRRGSYKRRKASHSWTKDTIDLIDDGHAWRKYGQKTILNKRHPRNYFRCTHKFDQGCKATKHVQMIKEEPQLFRTTYYGNHTCTDYLRTPELILDWSCPIESSKNIIRFDSTNKDVDFTSKQEHPFFSFFTSIKKENVKEEMTAPISHLDHMNTSHHNQSPSSGDYVVSQTCLGAPTFESSDPICGFSSFDQYDEADVMEQFLYDIDFSYEI